MMGRPLRKTKAPNAGRHNRRVVVIGAGVGGLATAAVLARAGLDVTVLEAHIYPGGSAGTFFHNGFRFDAGATLAAGFYPGGPMDLLARAAKITAWQGTAADVIMRVHLPEAPPITRYAGTERHLERAQSFTPIDQRFWAWQESTAALVWDLAAKIPPWPPLDWDQALTLARLGVQALRESAPQAGLLSLLFDAARPLAHRSHGSSEILRLFLDAQLLISAQTDSNSANALYAAAALDLPRRGAAHLAGGMGSLAQALVTSIQSHGGEVHFRRKVKAIEFKNSQPIGVRLTRGGAIPADVVVANLTPWSLSALLPSRIMGHFRRLRTPQESGWGAFTVYAGAPAGVIPLDSPLHHQVVLGRPLGEGNSVFISASPPWDATRAPDGLRALTLSTHTRLGPWWQLFRHDRDAYESRKKRMAQALLAAADRAFPALSETAAPVLPGTPITFERFTQRAMGWVGGFPQTRAMRGLNPHIRPDVWLVGDSIFPGQSTAAVALGGLRVADGVLHSLGMPALDTFLQAPDAGDARLRTPGIQADPTSGRKRRAQEHAPQTELTNPLMKPNHEDPGGTPARLQHREAAPC